MLCQQDGQDLVLEILPDLRVAEERGDADQHLLEQQVQLLRVRAQEVGVGGHRIQAMHGHAPGDAAHQRVRLVGRQIVPGVFMQQRQDGVQRRCGLLGLGTRCKAPAGRVPVMLRMRTACRQAGR
jgi:hypothetical protein